MAALGIKDDIVEITTIKDTNRQYLNIYTGELTIGESVMYYDHSDKKVKFGHTMFRDIYMGQWPKEENNG